eukprot:CAMPEP_0185497824 /NCGR_PEP_ID=MMETSP1366-20130426/19236_1 /TAXON_ID=38817 /ORGANISM="Gephyrocapsa oceanica, Strain RCC1303" /LENGTH=153 /DNA_ID=CAMNT_0028106943 /DNA_START=227 /DNA_END=688 /DNA_ORIENTATION=+
MAVSGAPRWEGEAENSLPAPCTDSEAHLRRVPCRRGRAPCATGAVEGHVCFGQWRAAAPPLLSGRGPGRHCEAGDSSPHAGLTAKPAWRGSSTGTRLAASAYSALWAHGWPQAPTRRCRRFTPPWVAHGWPQAPSRRFTPPCVLPGQTRADVA